MIRHAWLYFSSWACFTHGVEVLGIARAHNVEQHLVAVQVMHKDIQHGSHLGQHGLNQHFLVTSNNSVSYCVEGVLSVRCRTVSSVTSSARTSTMKPDECVATSTM